MRDRSEWRQASRGDVASAGSGVGAISEVFVVDHENPPRDCSRLTMSKSCSAQADPLVSDTLEPKEGKPESDTRRAETPNREEANDAEDPRGKAARPALLVLPTSGRDGEKSEICRLPSGRRTWSSIGCTSARDSWTTSPSVPSLRTRSTNSKNWVERRMVYGMLEDLIRFSCATFARR
jgi:hypothetical protein